MSPTPDAVPALATDAITVSFGGRAVLDRMTMAVAPHEIVALRGPSGSGKTTLLRVITGLLQPDSGRVLVDGVDVTTEPTHRRRIGMVFQDNQLFPHADVAHNVDFGLRMRGVERAARRRRVEEMLDLVGLSGFERRAVTALSGGEAKRVALARSLAPDPSVLLLDEPLTGLDSELHDQLAVDLAALLRARGVAALLVTHDAGEVAAIADRAVLIGSRG
jgi:thiamine transport system ATP-binding protein